MIIKKNRQKTKEGFRKIKKFTENVDKINMSIREYISLFISVLTDFRVIVTVVAMLLVIEFAKFVTSYRKKPRKPKKKKVQVANQSAPQAKKEETDDDSSSHKEEVHEAKTEN